MVDLLLDTAVFRDYGNGDPGARAIIERVINGQTKGSVSSVTLFELWTSAGLDRKAEIGYVGILSFLEEASLSCEAARMAGVWVSALEESERGRLSRFALVAAIAKERGEPICTRDTVRFGRFYSELISC